MREYTLEGRYATSEVVATDVDAGRSERRGQEGELHRALGRNDVPCVDEAGRRLDRIRLKEPERVRFGRDVKALLGSAAAKWEDEDCEEASEPLGRYRTDVTEALRVELAAHPARLVELVQACFTELFEMTQAIDETLKKYREGR